MGASGRATSHLASGNSPKTRQEHLSPTSPKNALAVKEPTAVRA